jgi:peptidyl-prolyl cis-trans isomerase C
MKKMTLNLIALSALVLTFYSVAQAGTIATVNGKVITDEDLQSLVANLPEVQKSNLLKDSATRKQLVDSLIDQELMYQDAMAKKVESSKEYVAALAAFKKQALVNILVQKQLAPKITNEAVKSFYAKNKIKYATDQVHAQHILLGTEKEAQDVLAEAKKGADFQKLAESKSKDPSAKNNRGDLGYFGRDNFDPAFVEASFTSKVGDIVGPVKSAFGYHVIKIVDRKVGKNPEFAEVENKVRADLQRETLQGYVSALKLKAKIKQ